jgi:hypothetical protein
MTIAPRTLVTLIPAYKPDYLGELFLGLATQSFKDFRVVVSDDSPGGAITQLMKSRLLEPLLRSLDVVVVQGPRRGSVSNVRHLIEGFARHGRLVHLLMDDDLVYPDFYRAHVQAHARGTVGASVSQRWLTAADGRPGASLPLPGFLDQLADRTVYLDGEAMFASTAALAQNWLGEFSNAVLSQGAAARLARTEIQGLSYFGLADIGVLLDTSRVAPIAFIRDHLGGFRSHPGQTTHATQSFALKCGYVAWIALALAGRRAGLLSDSQTLSALATSIGRCVAQLGSDPALAELFTMAATIGADLKEFDRWFEGWWSRLLETNADSRRVAAAVAELQPA